MTKQDSAYQMYLSILREELVPAMGCTEPIAVAYAAAKARDVLGAMPDEVDVGVSGSIIKNVKSVIVPNTGHMKGIEAAAAAGIVAGDASRELEVIASVKPDEIKAMETFRNTVPIKVHHIDNGLVFDIVVTEKHGDDVVQVRIAVFHTNIVHIEKNGEVLLDLPVEENHSDSQTDRFGITMETIWDFVNTVEIEDVKEVLDRQIRCNMAIAEEGMRNDYGANIGKVLLNSYGNSIENRAKAMAAAGSDARMNGCEMPVIINSGSGNQGMTVSVPVITYARETGASEEKLYRALCLANLTAIHQKTRIGRLSAYCGAVNAGAGAGCGIAYLNGGDYRAVVHTLVNALAIISGMICDGAKASCAAKIAAAIDAGLMGYHMFQNNQQFYSGDGIVGSGVESNIVNIGRLGRDGMRETNNEIINIMLGE